jgi:hypothetical protein
MFDTNKKLRFKGIKDKFVARFISDSLMYSIDCFVVFKDEMDFIGFCSLIPDTYAITICYRNIALLVIS